MGINTAKSSNNKTHKFLRNATIIASILTVMNTTQSCKNKNAGMPVHADPIEFSQKESTDTTSEYIQIDDNKVTLNYTFDMDENAEWNKKNIQYTLEVNRGEDNKIIATLKGSTYYGAESDRGVTPENENTYSQEFAYDSPKDLNERFPDEISRYINSVMSNLQDNNKIYQTTPDDFVHVNEEAQKEINEKTAKLTGYLKYKMNAHELSVVQQGDEVVLPITRNGNRFDFIIKENATGIKLQNNKKENAKTYDITLNGKTITVALSKNDLTFAQELTKELEKMLKVGDISQKIEDEAFLGKGLEVKQLLDKH